MAFGGRHLLLACGHLWRRNAERSGVVGVGWLSEGNETNKPVSQVVDETLAVERERDGIRYRYGRRLLPTVRANPRPVMDHGWARRAGRVRTVLQRSVQQASQPDSHGLVSPRERHAPRGTVAASVSVKF